MAGLLSAVLKGSLWLTIPLLLIGVGVIALGEWLEHQSRAWRTRVANQLVLLLEDGRRIRRDLSGLAGMVGDGPMNVWQSVSGCLTEGKKWETRAAQYVSDEFGIVERDQFLNASQPTPPSLEEEPHIPKGSPGVPARTRKRIRSAWTWLDDRLRFLETLLARAAR